MAIVVKTPGMEQALNLAVGTLDIEDQARRERPAEVGRKRAHGHSLSWILPPDESAFRLDAAAAPASWGSPSVDVDTSIDHER